MNMKFLRSLWLDKSGQDLVEYALMAGFVAVAAGAILPGAMEIVATVFGKTVAAMEGRSPQLIGGTETEAILRTVCAVLAVAFLGVIVIRRKKYADE